MRPTTEQELADIIKAARGPLRIRGGGTRVQDVCIGEVLDTEGLSGISLYEPGALTLVVGAGTPLETVQALLAGERQRLAFEPPDMAGMLGRTGISTIGGVVADNASGPRRVQVGACRDALIGIRMVDGRGEVIRNGGRVMKNVTGYDLVKLMAGSRGSLGVLSEVSFKLQAQPEQEVTLCAQGMPADAALTTLRRALASPFDISGAAHLDAAAAGGVAQTMIRIEGLAGSVAYRAKALAQILPDSRALEGAESAALWRGIRDVAPFAGVAGAVWRLAVKPTEAQSVPLALMRAGVDYRAIWDWGGARLWLLVATDAAAIIGGAVAGIGHASLVRPMPGMTGGITLPGEDAGVLALTGGLRKAFDPRGILNQSGGTI